MGANALLPIGILLLTLTSLSVLYIIIGIADKSQIDKVVWGIIGALLTASPGIPLTIIGAIKWKK